MDPPAADGRVREAALSHLGTRGFALTTLEDIARAADVGEAEVRSLYGDEEGLIRHLTSPLLSSLYEVTASAATADLRCADELRPVIEGYLDALMNNRTLVRVILGDPAAATSESTRLVRHALLVLRDALARGAGPGLDGQIRAASALGALQAAVLEPTEFEPSLVREVIADAAVAILLS